MRIETYRFSIGRREPLRLAFLSDLHDTENEPILAALAQEKPRAVLIGGDLVHDQARYQRGLALLEALTPHYPVFCAIGNHEKHFGIRISWEISARGAILLDDSDREFEGIWLGGLSSGYLYDHRRSEKVTPAPNLGFLEKFSKREGFKLLLSHHPEYYPRYIQKLPIDLTLSGHAHGGQWRLFDRGIYAPGQGLFPKYTSGLHEGRLLVSRGLGNAYPIPRIGNPPELIIIELGE